MLWKVLELLIENGAQASYADENAPSVIVNDREMTTLELSSQSIQEFDATIILVNHDGLNLHQVVEHSKLVIDGQNATKGLPPSLNVARI